jgi:hypothetical protein
MPKKSKSTEPQSDEPENPLEAGARQLREDLRASGLTVTEMEEPTDTTKYDVTFVPRRKTKQ